MAKRTKGKGSRPPGPMKRRDSDAKKKRRDERPDAPPADAPVDEEADASPEPEEPKAPVAAADDDDEELPPPPSSRPPSSKKGEDPVSVPVTGEPEGAPWALPFLRFDAAWTRFEERAIVVVLGLLTVVLVFWAGMKSMSEAVASPIAAGWAFRALFGAVVLGLIARFATNKRMEEGKRTLVTIGAVILGFALASVWRGVGIAFFSGLLEWLQKGSVVNLYGGLLGVSTRLAILVALIGGSLACATGSHIAIDIVVRFVPTSTRRPLAVISALATALVCVCAAWGFFDHVAITRMGAGPDISAGEKFSVVARETGNQFFLLRKQLKFDVAALPYVLEAEKWNAPERLDGKGWNAFLDAEGFAERFGEEKLHNLRAAGHALEQPYEPNVGIPAFRINPKMHLTAVDLIWPIGFLVMAMRLIIRALLIASRQVKLQLEGEEDEDEPAEEAA
jgi:TRAP-type C4-dicarboxylate transport system permease small subunit